MRYLPPIIITPLIFAKAQEIARLLGIIAGQKISAGPLQLRRTNSIKTIHASLAIEGNTLSLDQMTALFAGNRVIGPKKDILEVKNALAVYEQLASFDPLKIPHLLKAHRILMNGLVEENGKWRSGAVGIFKGTLVRHVAPPAKRVPQLIGDLFDFLRHDSSLSWLIKSCIFHYEIEFIHPFSDGNGRIGRLWQQLLLMKADPVFNYLPLEVVVKNNQETYYQSLAQSDKSGASTPFVEFSLGTIQQALEDYYQSTAPLAKDPLSRLHFAKGLLTTPWFSRRDYLVIHKDISTATASRDLLWGIKNGVIEKKGERNQVEYRFSLL